MSFQRIFNELSASVFIAKSFEILCVSVFVCNAKSFGIAFLSFVFLLLKCFLDGLPKVFNIRLKENSH